MCVDFMRFYTIVYTQVDSVVTTCDDGLALSLKYDLHGSHPSVNQTSETYLKESKGH